MAFCYYCGANLEEGTSFCPSCGKPIGGRAAEPEAQPLQAEAPKRMSGGTRAKGIISLALSIESLSVTYALLIFLWLQFVVHSIPRTEEDVVFFGMLFIFLYILIFTLLGGGFAIAGWILGNKAIKEAPTYKLAKIGRCLSVAALISSGVFLLLSCLLLIL